MQKEHVEYMSDFSDRCFDSFYPDVEVKFEFNYGSEFDGSRVEFHLTDQEAKHVLDFIKMNLSGLNAGNIFKGPSPSFFIAI